MHIGFNNLKMPDQQTNYYLESFITNNVETITRELGQYVVHNLTIRLEFRDSRVSLRLRPGPDSQIFLSPALAI